MLPISVPLIIGKKWLVRFSQDTVEIYLYTNFGSRTKDNYEQPFSKDQL